MKHAEPATTSTNLLARSTMVLPPARRRRMCHHRRRRGARGLGGRGARAQLPSPPPPALRPGPVTRLPGRPQRHGPRPCAAPWLLSARPRLRLPGPDLGLGSGSAPVPAPAPAPARAPCGPVPATLLRAAPRTLCAAPRAAASPQSAAAPPRPAPGPPPRRLLPLSPAPILGSAPWSSRGLRGFWDPGLWRWPERSEEGRRRLGSVSCPRVAGSD